MSVLAVERNAWRALFAAQVGWMLDAMDFLLFIFAIVPIQKEFALSSATMGGLTSVALIAGAVGGIAFGRIADAIGRVRAMTVSILVYSFATAGLATSQALWQLIAWGVVTWLPAFLATPIEKGGAGLTITKSAAWLIALQVGAFFGYISFGWFADKIGRRAAFTFFMIAATAVVPLFAFEARSRLTLLIIGPLVGYFCHGYFSLFGAMLSELFPTRIRASAQGFCYNAGRLASAAAPLAIGAAAQEHGLGLGIAVDALFFAVGAVLVWMLPETKGAEL